MQESYFFKVPNPRKIHYLLATTERRELSRRMRVSRRGLVRRMLSGRLTHAYLGNNTLAIPEHLMTITLLTKWRPGSLICEGVSFC
jgi:hypothetical protein